MKSPKYYDLKNGEVVDRGPFATGYQSVQAPNKTEATKYFLTLAEKALAHSPQLRIKNGAFLMVWHNGEKFVAESGPLDRANIPLCAAQYDTLEKALADSTFNYYASEDYQAAHKAFASVQPIG